MNRPVAVRRLLLRARLRAHLWSQRSNRDDFSPPGRARVFVGLAADYGNLGDLAITQAQIGFLERRFPDHLVVPLPISRTLSDIPRLRRNTRPGDILSLIGGGNTGDMYDDIQYLRELLIRACPGLPILSFPQTIDFSESRYGRWARRRAARLYRSHPDLHMIGRDTSSLSVLRTSFRGCPATLGPDVVLTLCPTLEAVQRAGTLLVVRADQERADHTPAIAALHTAFARFGPVTSFDTHVGDVRVDAAGAAELLRSMWRAYAGAEIVVTDRLHGMIFAVITGTPCIALDSRTAKVSRFYRDWLESVPFVTLAETGDHTELVGLADRMRAERPSDSERRHRAEYFSDRLADAIPESIVEPEGST